MSSPSSDSRVGLGEGLCADPASSSQQNFLGSRRQRCQSPSSLGNMASCLAWKEDFSSAVARANAPRSPAKEFASRHATSPGSTRSQSPPKREMPSNFGQDSVPLPPYVDQRATNPAPSPHLRGRPHRREEEFDVDAYRSVRCQAELSQRTPAPIGKDESGQHDCNKFVFFGKEGKALGNVRRVRSVSPAQLHEEGFLSSRAKEFAAGHEQLFVTTGPRAANFRAIVGAPCRRRGCIPGEAPLPSNSQEMQLEPFALLDSSGLSPRDIVSTEEAPAAGRMSPRYERSYGLIPRSPEDDVFRAESKQGSRRHGYGSQASTNAPTPSNGSRDLGKGLSPEDTQLCIEAFLGERRRKAHGSPWASPGSSPWASPPASPRQLSPPGTPTRGGGATLSWNAIAPDDGIVADLVAREPLLPTWSPRTTSSCRNAAVTMHRAGSPVSVGAPVVADKKIEEKFRGREMMYRRQGASNAKTRWR